LSVQTLFLILTTLKSLRYQNVATNFFANFAKKGKFCKFRIMAFNPNRNQEYRIDALLEKVWENGITGQQGIDKMKASNFQHIGILLLSSHFLISLPT
jgi:hypothetical protein